MSDLKHVLFVCTGNTCRSPMAEAIFRNAVASRPDYVTSSAGIAASNGSPCNPETAVLLKRRGLTLDGFGSRVTTEKIISEATHVFAMTRDHLDVLESRFPQHTEKFYLACEFVEIPNEGIGMDLPDPIGMGRRAYEEVAEVLDAAIPAIISYIDQTWKPCKATL